MKLRAARSPYRSIASLREQPVLDRKAVCFHYEHAMRHRDLAFSVETVEKWSFGHASVTLILLASLQHKHQALYSARRSEDSGFVFRRLHPEVEGAELRVLLDQTKTEDFANLALLGLSYDEIGAMTGRSRDQLRKVFRKS